MNNNFRKKNQITSSSSRNYKVEEMKKTMSMIKQLIIKKLNDFELNNLEFKDAIKYDKRTFSQIYISLLKTNHLLIFSFCHLKDYNSQIIKIYLFFFNYAMNLVVSAMFYSDETMHKIYVDEGLFDFIYQLQQMIYSFIISTVLVNILNLLGLYEEDIVGIKKYKKSEKDISKVMSKIKIKIISFFMIEYII